MSDEQFEKEVEYSHTAINFALEVMEALQKGETTKKEVIEVDIPDIRKDLVDRITEDFLRTGPEQALRILEAMAR